MLQRRLVYEELETNRMDYIGPRVSGCPRTDHRHVLATHIRNRYLLTFQPASPKPGLHKLEVRLPQHPELTISARTSYWAAEPEPSPTK